MKTSWWDAEYLVQVFLNGIHWDSSYTDDVLEANRWKKDFENKDVSIKDRINGDALEQFVSEYNISNIELIEVTAKIIEI